MALTRGDATIFPFLFPNNHKEKVYESLRLTKLGTKLPKGRHASKINVMPPGRRRRQVNATNSSTLLTPSRCPSPSRYDTGYRPANRGADERA
ncbi:hypothetical protein SK128_001360 [Halocaridina rubra]|uniref:Uncharacterized protein n=1 Tax=Halocaridina rubra TaxID=373956 RepID=A0AAN8XHR0_HALRR